MILSLQQKLTEYAAGVRDASSFLKNVSISLWPGCVKKNMRVGFISILELHGDPKTPAKEYKQ